MFTTKQSDVFYNDQTKEMFVCKVSSISAPRCAASGSVYGALPIIYKIDKDTNYQSIIYPKNLDTFKDDTKSDLFDLLPPNYYGDNTDFAQITKPLINYNKTSDRYSVTCLGKYSATSDGFGILSYIFQYIDTNFYLLDARSYIPKAKEADLNAQFKDGYLNSDFIIGGNKLRWNEPIDTAYEERVTDYNIKPTHLDSNDSLGFNLIAYCPSAYSGVDCLTGSNQYPLLWSGGYITYNPKYAAFDPNYDIRVDFTAKSFNVPSMTAYRSKQSGNSDANPSRWIDRAVTTSATGGLSGAGSGFSVFFYRNPLVGIVEPQGIGSTLGYAKASSVVSEVAGETTAVQGLVINHSSYNAAFGYGPPANSFLGIGFDIKGDFCTTSQGKEGWLSAGGGAGSWSHGDAGSFTNTTAPCSVGIRGNLTSSTRVLTCISMSTVAASAVPMHEESANGTGSDVDFQDYRIDLTKKGTQVTVYNKLTSATDYNTILQFDLNSVKDENGDEYYPWGGFYNQMIRPERRGPVLSYPWSPRTPASKDPRQPTPRRISKMGHFVFHPDYNVGIGSGPNKNDYIFTNDEIFDPATPEKEEVWETDLEIVPYTPPGIIIDIQPFEDYSSDPILTLVQRPEPEISDFTYTPPPLVPPVIIDDEDDIKKYPGGRSPSQGLVAPLNVGLSFTTSEYTSHFELLSFKVTGVKMSKPTQLLQKTDNTTTVEYLEESSANLRKELVNIPTTDPVDITMSIKRSSLIDRIDLCGQLPKFVDSEVEAKWTGTRKIRDDIPGPPGEIPTTVIETSPPTKCSGWYRRWPTTISDPEGDTDGKRSGSGAWSYTVGSAAGTPSGPIGLHPSNTAPYWASVPGSDNKEWIEITAGGNRYLLQQKLSIFGDYAGSVTLPEDFNPNFASWPYATESGAAHPTHWKHFSPDQTITFPGYRDNNGEWKTLEVGTVGTGGFRSLSFLVYAKWRDCETTPETTPIDTVNEEQDYPTPEKLPNLNKDDWRFSCLIATLQITGNLFGSTDLWYIPYTVGDTTYKLYIKANFYAPGTVTQDDTVSYKTSSDEVIYYPKVPTYFHYEVWPWTEQIGYQFLNSVDFKNNSTTKNWLINYDPGTVLVSRFDGQGNTINPDNNFDITFSPINDITGYKKLTCLVQPNKPDDGNPDDGNGNGDEDDEIPAGIL